MQEQFDVEHLLSVAQQHGEDSGTDYEVGDLQEFLRAAWALLSEQQKAAFFASPAVAQAYEGATCSELGDVFPKNPFQVTRVVTDADVEHVECALGMGSTAWDTVDKKRLLAEAMLLAGVPAEVAKAPEPAGTPRRMRPR
jgi:hypothetical protein